MKLSNRFKPEDKLRVWLDHPYCVLCSSNQGCALHHIDGTSSGSIYNGIMLCDKCHKIADAHNTNSPLSKEYRDNLRQIAYNRVINSDHKNRSIDYDYNALHNPSSD